MRRLRIVILPRSSDKIQSTIMTCSSTSEQTMMPPTGIIYNLLLTTLITISFSIKPSLVWYYSNHQYCATHGFSKNFRLQWNKNEVSSDEESFVSITKVPYADPNMAEIYKAPKPDSDPLEPRVTRSKSKSLNNDDLIKGTEVNASLSDSESVAEQSSDAPRGLVKFKKALVCKTIDLSLPPTPTNITKGLSRGWVVSCIQLERVYVFLDVRERVLGGVPRRPRFT
jgi:hypothetical protein